MMGADDGRDMSGEGLGADLFCHNNTLNLSEPWQSLFEGLNFSFRGDRLSTSAMFTEHSWRR
jgi:hypothetical protein